MLLELNEKYSINWSYDYNEFEIRLLFTFNHIQ